jgi:HD-like signal output (HDOD) protein
MESQRLSNEGGLCGAPSDDAFTAGLPHDIGKIVMAGNIPDQYGITLAETREQGRPAWEVEMSLLGYNHAEIGAYLLGLWGLPLSVVTAVGWHHQPSLAPTPAPPALLLVHRADCQVRRQPPAA